jgi:nucleoside-diphosphate-sugar epimerase
MKAPATGTAPTGETRGLGVDSSRLLVTGAAGRVAGQLLPALADRDDVRLTDRTDGVGASGQRLTAGELTDPGLLDELLDGVDAVVHLAGNPDPDSSWSELREPNVEAFRVLLDAARRHDVQRVTSRERRTRPSTPRSG